MSWGLLRWPQAPAPVAGTAPDYIATLLEDYFGADVPVRPGQIEDLCRGLNLIVTLEKLPAGKMGQLREDRDNPKIVVDADVSRKQWAFVVAHEIGHYIVNRLHQQSRPELRPGVLPSDVLERICDAIAGDLILPQRWIADGIRADPDLGLEMLHRRADAYSVSRGALIQAYARAGAQLGWVRTAQYNNGSTHVTSKVGEYRVAALQSAQQLPPARDGHSSRDGGFINGRRYALDCFSRRYRGDLVCEYLLRPI
jgi:Zn-dependent peptidase ImmA (M78 family)